LAKPYGKAGGAGLFGPVYAFHGDLRNKKIVPILIILIDEIN